MYTRVTHRVNALMHYAQFAGKFKILAEDLNEWKEEVG